MASHQTSPDKKTPGVILKLGRFLPTTSLYFIFTCGSCASSTVASYLWLVVAAKIFPLLTLINYVVVRCHGNIREALRCWHSRFILLGLCFSMLGDVLLVFQDIGNVYFVSGLVAFLIGHLMYIGAFSWTPLQLRPILLIKFIITALLLYWYLWDGKLSSEPIAIQIGVFAYAITIALMNWSSWAGLVYGNLVKGNWHQLLGCVGAAFFLVSDSLLAINKFRSPISHENLLIMGTYYLAQFFIALSVDSHQKSS